MTNYPLYSSDTVNLALPLARREANTLRPLAVAILERKPCLFFNKQRVAQFFTQEPLISDQSKLTAWGK